MEFKERLQELRKASGMTQEQLSERLHISRTAVSKWESGRGMPNIEALKHISAVFSVSLDELLTGRELLDAAESDGRERVGKLGVLAFGLLDLLAGLIMFVPLFSHPVDGFIAMVNLFAYDQEVFLKIAFFVALTSLGSWGIAALAAHVVDSRPARRALRVGSLVLHSLAIAVFIMCREPYVAFFLFAFLAAKIALMARENR